MYRGITKEKLKEGFLRFINAWRAIIEKRVQNFSYAKAKTYSG